MTKPPLTGVKKRQVTLTLDPRVVEKGRKIAQAEKISLSALVEELIEGYYEEWMEERMKEQEEKERQRQQWWGI